jgi:thiol-disulfide isomerase/thioredoxin
MKKLFLLLFPVFFFQGLIAQTLLTEAENFHIKTIDGETIWLFPILDEEEQIVVIDFFSTTCGPCQDYADDFQRSYEAFGSNSGNVYHMGINWGNDNQGVREFDSIYGLTFPSVSGSQGGGNIVFNQYQIQSYPTVIVINTAHEITDQYVWLPSEENIEEAIIAAGGILVGTTETEEIDTPFSFFPNPVKNKASIRVDLKEAANVKFEVYNMLGKRFTSGEQQFWEAGNYTIPVPVSRWANGIYFIKIITGNKEVKTIRFIIDK